MTSTLALLRQYELLAAVIAITGGTPHLYAQDATPVLPMSYAERIDRLAGVPVNIDALYNEAIVRRMALDSAIHRAGARMFGKELSTLEILRRMRTDSQLVMQDPDSIVNAYSAGLARARARLGTLFDTIPDAPIKVQAIPQAQAASAAPAAYRRANRANGADTATFLVNAYQPRGIARMNILLGIAHEGYPGHHFQTLYALMKGTSAQATADNGAYVEGWGIYAEQLADEAGLYDDDPVAKLGYLIHLFDVFIALQVDLGVHARGWTHAMAVDTMLAVAGRPFSQAQSYANRHDATPGQLASYGLGLTAIVHQRERATTACGKRFDIRRFHAVVLADGQSSLPAMAQRVTAWILLPEVSTR